MGCVVGSTEGQLLDGSDDGCLLGRIEGNFDGSEEGSCEGLFVGLSEEALVGQHVGSVVGVDDVG